MKNMRKIFAVVLAVMMVMAMATTAFAANITIDDGDITGATYQAYKLLNATDGGSGKIAYTVNSTYLSALQAATGKTTETDIIDYISGLDADGIRNFADAVYAQVKTMTADATAENNVFSNVAQGYYLIVETATGTTPDTMGDDSYSLVMLDTAGNDDITVNTKENVPTVDKKVQEKNDSTGDSSWGDTADYDVGDTISYEITGTVSDRIANYKTYSYLITDTMDAGLTYNKDAKVYVVNGDSKVEVTNQFTITPTTNGFTASADLKTLTGVTISATTKIVVEYTATLNENAVSGSVGNKNTVKLTYNRNPYYDGTGTPETGDTPEDTNIVFTYDVIVNKIDKNNNALPGAGFTLYKWVVTQAAVVDNPDTEEDETKAAVYGWVAVSTEITGVTTFEFKKLDEGKYKLVETTVPAGYNKAADIEFTVESTLDDTNEELDELIVKDTAGNVISADNPETVDVNEKSFDANISAGSVTTNVVNNAGTELPTTGGMGTTLFYVFGGIMVVAAVVLLVTKKRMASAE